MRIHPSSICSSSSSSSSNSSQRNICSFEQRHVIHVPWRESPEEGVSVAKAESPLEKFPSSLHEKMITDLWLTQCI
ncbi:hypothetical protein SK128_003922, partial [Halocaridina rubra]